MKRSLLASLVVCAVVIAVVAPGIAAATPSPTLTATLTNDTVSPGQETGLAVSVSNAPQVSATGYTPGQLSKMTTARNVRVTMRSGGAPIDVKTGTQVLSTQLAEGTTLPATFQVAVDQNAAPGTYTVPLHVTYIYSDSAPTATGGARDDKKVDETLDVTVHVKNEPRFSVVHTATNASVGDTGTTRLTLRNVGTRTAHDARVTVSPVGSQFVVGGGHPVTSYVGEWPTGENRTVSVASSVAPGADATNYSLSAQVTYANANGNTRQSDSLTASVAPLAKQSFALSDVASSLRAGTDGHVNATVTNTGPTSVSNAVVTISASSAGVTPKRAEYAVGTLASGASTRVSFPVEVTSNAKGGPRQVSLGVTYTNDGGKTRKSDALPATVDVAAKRDRFRVTPVDATVTAGGGRAVTFRLTNQGNVSVTNVNAKVYASSPISAGDDQAFVASLAPGETRNVTFRLSASGGALAKAYPVSMDFQYDTGGETKLSKYYQVPVRVSKPSGNGGLPLGLVGGVVVLAVLVAGGYVYYRRRQ